MAESYHTRRVLSPEEFSFAMDMLNTYPWISRPMHRRGFDEMMDRLILTPDERGLLEMLFGKFRYVDVDEGEELLQSIVEQLEVWGCNKNNTVFVATRDDSADNDGSVVFLKQLQDHLFEWSEKRFQNLFDFKRKFKIEKNYEKIVVIDDFIGSGFTINERYKMLQAEIAKLKRPRDIYVVALAGMDAAKAGYPFLAQDNVYVPLWLDKTFERNVDKHETQIMDGILTRLNNRNNDSKPYELSKCGFGFGDMAGAYFNVHYRMSDNMLAIFWWGRFKENKDTFHSMFRRA